MIFIGLLEQFMEDLRFLNAEVVFTFHLISREESLCSVRQSVLSSWAGGVENLPNVQDME